MKSTETFTLKSNTIGGQATTHQAFNDWGSVGQNISPQLSWENAPEGTNSFAITMYDPDAPTGSGWWHWVMFDIASNINEIAENTGNLTSNLAPAKAIQSINDYGAKGYGGPCPPIGHGTHPSIQSSCLVEELPKLEINTS